MNRTLCTTASHHFLFGVFIFMFCQLSGAQPNEQQVSELQTGHYLPGIINIRDYVNPAPVSGFMFVDYNLFLSGSQYFDKDGNELKQIIGPNGNPIDLNSKVSGYVNSLNILWASNFKILGANYLGGISATYNTVSLNIAYNQIGEVDGINNNGTISGKDSGFSDLGVIPILLSWGKDQFDLTAGYMVYAPTGKYKSGGDDNLGLGFWSHLIQFYGYYYPLKMDGSTSKTMAIMVSGNYELTSKIKDADVKPGNRFSIDYGISQYLSDKLEVGIFGGNNWQISEDKGSEVYWDTSIKDKIGVVGFQAGYWIWPDRIQAAVKYGFNYGAVQQFEMNTMQLNLTFIADAITN
jgi:hypothetical protein